METDLTIADAVNDPMIGMLLKADGVPPAAFAQLLQSAARLRRIELEAAATGNAGILRRAAATNTPHLP